MAVKCKRIAGTIVPEQLRKIPRDRLRKLRSAVTMAVRHCINQDIPFKTRHNE